MDQRARMPEAIDPVRFDKTMDQLFHYMADNMVHYCKVFIDSPQSREELKTHICTENQGEDRGFTVYFAWGLVDLRRNDEWSPEKFGRPDGFLFSKFYADIEPAKDIDESEYVRNVAKFVSSLRATGNLVVPACDFEESLESMIK
jgi:hypothetical protein